jgi:hypothetical protein
MIRAGGSMSYLQIAMAVFIALVSGLICAYAARRMGKQPWPWFLFGFCLPGLSVMLALPLLYLDWLNRDPRT